MGDSESAAMDRAESTGRNALDLVVNLHAEVMLKNTLNHRFSQFFHVPPVILALAAFGSQHFVHSQVAQKPLNPTHPCSVVDLTTLCLIYEHISSIRTYTRDDTPMMKSMDL